jgi:hypothetical protein
MLIEDNMIKTETKINILNQDEMYADIKVVQNNIPILEQNYVEKMNAGNGFSKERMFRKIASIPVVAHFEASQNGFNLDNEDELRKYLSINPEFLTVSSLDTGASGKIIIK